MAVENCDNCGVCCFDMNVPHFSGVGNDFCPPKLWAEIEAYQNSPRYRADALWPCLWLNRLTGRCIHYEHRPQVCREFQPGDETCLRLRREVGIED